MELKYRTRGGTAPQGKPRVYFTAHPQDYDKYLEEISRDILEISDCTIWHSGAETGEYSQETLFDLRQMKLFVIPVTARLFRTENRALYTDYRFARENNIRVLPIVEEPGLLEQDNLKILKSQSLDRALAEEFCSLQMLDRCGRDATAIPYEEKLKRFLSFALIKDKMAARIRKEFDAHIFLSYRKKDRIHAQRLMEEIHRSGNFQDIGFWYDEFLVPGENFDGEIKDHLEECSLFALAVTPNMVNETNYVMTREYPMAAKCHKPILPVEVVPTTDKEEQSAALYTSFQGLPRCIDIHDRDALAKALRAELEKLSLGGSNESPRHSYLIGLAYLNGIDVEVDKARALALLRRASEAGLIEATAKLADMYKFGDGVTRSLPECIRYMELWVSQQEDLYFHSGMDEDGLEIIHTLDYLLESYEIIQDFSGMERAAERMKQTCERMEAHVAEETRPTLLRLSFLATERMGHIWMKRGRLDRARECFQQSLNQTKQEYQKFKHASFQKWAQVRLDFGVDLFHMGDLSCTSGHLQEALAYFQEGLALYQEVDREADAHNRSMFARMEQEGSSQQTDGPQMIGRDWLRKLQDDMGTLYDRIGTVKRRLGLLEEARDSYQKAMEIAVRLDEEYCTAETVYTRVVYERNLGRLCMSMGDWRSAEIHLTVCERVLHKLCQDMGLFENLRDFSVVLSDLGELYASLRNWEKAKEYYLRSLEVISSLCEDGQVLEWQGDLAKTYGVLSQMCVRLDGPSDEAVEYCRRELNIFLSICPGTEELNYWNGLAAAYIRMGDLCFDRKNLDGAEENYQCGLTTARKIQQMQGTEGQPSQIDACCQRLGDIYRKRDQLDRARSCYQEALRLALLRCQGQKAQMPHNLWNAAMGYKYLEDLSAQEENWAEAAGLCQKEVGYLVGLYEQTKLIQDVQKLADSEFRMGEYCRRLNRPADEAKLWYRDCAQLRRQILEEQDTPETREDLVRVCARLSEIAADEEDWEASLGYEREKYQTFEPLIRAEGLDQRAVRTSLSIFANSISSLLCRKLGRPEEAPPYLYQAVQLRGELCREQWNPEMVKSIYYGCIALKEIYEIFGQLDRAEEACRLNVEWCQELHQTWFKVFTAFHLASASLELSKLQFRQKDRMEEAEQSCTKALKLFLSLENQIEYLDLAPALFQAFYHMAELCRARGNLEETERFLKAADGVLVRVRVQREPDPEDLRAQLLCLEALGDLYLEQGRRQEAWDHLEYAVTVSQKLAEMKSAIDDYDRLAAALFRLGAFPGRVDRGLLEDAHSIWDQMSRYSPEYKEKRDQVRRVLDQEQKW